VHELPLEGNRIKVLVWSDEGKGLPTDAQPTSAVSNKGKRGSLDCVLLMKKGTKCHGNSS